MSETWLKSCYHYSSINIPEFTSYRHDREKSRGGGVLIYVKKRFRTKVVARSTCAGVEYIFVELSFKSNNSWLSLLASSQNIFIKKFAEGTLNSGTSVS